MLVATRYARAPACPGKHGALAFELLRNGPDCRFRLGDGPERAAQVETPEPGMYSVLLDGLSYDTSVEETLTGLVVVVDEIGRASCRERV